MPRKKKQNTDKLALPIVDLVVNVLVFPGLGSIIGGRINQGIWQIIILLGSIILGILLIVTLVGAIVGIPLLILGILAAWIWGLITGIQLIQEAYK